MTFDWWDGTDRAECGHDPNVKDLCCSLGGKSQCYSSVTVKRGASFAAGIALHLKRLGKYRWMNQEGRTLAEFLSVGKAHNAIP